MHSEQKAIQLLFRRGRTYIHCPYHLLVYPDHLRRFLRQTNGRCAKANLSRSTKKVKQFILQTSGAGAKGKYYHQSQEMLTLEVKPDINKRNRK